MISPNKVISIVALNLTRLICTHDPTSRVGVSGNSWVRAFSGVWCLNAKP